jgi:hypothetical protein
MKNSDPSLDRLLRAAAQYRPAVEEEPPFGFTTRVVAGWLAGAGAERIKLDEKLQAMWFRRALLCAVAVMAISVGWSFKTDTAAPTDEMAIASYDPTADLP